MIKQCRLEYETNIKLLKKSILIGKWSTLLHPVFRAPRAQWVNVSHSPWSAAARLTKASKASMYKGPAMLSDATLLRVSRTLAGMGAKLVPNITTIRDWGRVKMGSCRALHNAHANRIGRSGKENLLKKNTKHINSSFSVLNDDARICPHVWYLQNFKNPIIKWHGSRVTKFGCLVPLCR